jgi:hypothetical protein
MGEAATNRNTNESETIKQQNGPIFKINAFTALSGAVDN